MDVALATAAALPGLDQDDHVLLDILVRRGLKVAPVVWDDPDEDWSAHELCVIRSCWDYPVRRDDFVAWTQHVESVTCLWNSAKIIEWNTHKSYLHDLQQRGITVVPTLMLARGDSVSLDEIMTDQRWENVVLKPAVAVSGRGTIRAQRDEVVVGQRHLDRLLLVEDMLVQPFVSSVVTHGELSVIVVDGDITHAVRKLADDGQFRVQEEYGGVVERAWPSAAAIAFVERVLESIPFHVRYGRIDLVDADDGTMMVSELELVEPELYFKYANECAERLADLIERELS